nr:DUF1206 domain-containing protein [Actinomycetales bacterium]
MPPSDLPRAAAGRVQRSSAFRWLVAVGLSAYGVVHLLIAWLAVLLAFGSNPEDASQEGALRQVASAPFGVVLLWLVAAGFLVLVLWQLFEATSGHRDREGAARLRKRVSSAGRAVIYAGLGFLALRALFAPGSGGGEEAPESVSQGLLGLPFGQWMVGLVGLGIVAFGVWYAFKGVTRRFTEDLASEIARWGEMLGTIGHLAKGVAFTIMGGLFVWAAVTHDPEQAGGLDSALGVVRDQPFGQVLLVVLGIGLAAFGIYCFFWARHPRLTAPT